MPCPYGLRCIARKIENMTKSIRPFKVELVMPEGAAETFDATSAVLPASDGQVGILGGRSPVVVRLGAGEMIIEGRDGHRAEYFACGGFARMRGDVLTVLAEHCQLIERIDPDFAWDEIEKARKMPVETDEQVAVRDEALHVARTRFRLIQKGREVEEPDSLE